MISRIHRKFLLKYIRKARFISFFSVIFLMVISVFIEAVFLKALQNITLSIQETDFNSITSNTLIALVLTISSGLLKIFQLKYYVKYSADIGKLICVDTINGYFGKNLKLTTNQSSNDLINSIIVQSNFVTNGVILGFLNLLNYSLISIGIIFILVLNLGFKIISLILFMVLMYIVIAKINTDKYKLISKKQVDFINKLTNNLLYLINNKKRVFLNRKNFDIFRETYFLDSKYRNFLADNKELLVLPKFFVETLSITMLLIILMVLSKNGDQLIISKIGLLFFGILRILPSFQNIYYSWGQIKSNTAQIDAFIQYSNSFQFQEIEITPDHKIESIEIYDKSRKILSINKGELICIDGESGSGKTTFLDLLCSLYKVKDIKVVYLNKNGKLINEDYAKKQISFIEQDVYLKDNTVWNIIFNNPLKKIEFRNESYICELAQLKEIMLSDFWKKIPIGGSGGNLSGGQKQRVAIAESLAWGPSVLILDEATTGIDSQTEQIIWDNLVKIKDLTLIAVTHNKNIQRKFDRVINIKDLDLINKKVI